MSCHKTIAAHKLVTQSKRSNSDIYAQQRSSGKNGPKKWQEEWQEGLFLQILTNVTAAYV